MATLSLSVDKMNASVILVIYTVKTNRREHVLNTPRLNKLVYNCCAISVLNDEIETNMRRSPTSGSTVVLPTIKIYAVIIHAIPVLFRWLKTIDSF